MLEMVYKPKLKMQRQYNVDYWQNYLFVMHKSDIFKVEQIYHSFIIIFALKWITVMNWIAINMQS